MTNLQLVPAQTPYQIAYAQWAPFYRDLWKHKTVEQRAYAKRDILVTLKLWESESDGEYVGKLYAELDAIRDAEHAESRRATRRTIN